VLFLICGLSVEQVTEVLSEVNMLKDRQEDTDSKLETMKMENEALWQEVMLLSFLRVYDNTW
jgi:hypothetical protein